MGISSAFNSSVSGLATTSRWADLTAGNIANASNEGYVRKNLVTQSSVTGGVFVTGISREVDSNLDRMFRFEIAGVARQEVIANELDGYSFQLGNPSDTLSMSGQLSQFYAGFGLLSNSPGDVSLQNNVLATAKGLTRSLNEASNSLAQTRTNVSAGIQNDVSTVNNRLNTIASLNAQIMLESAPTERRAILQDERAAEMDALSQLMNINVSQDTDGNLNISTGGGTQLVDRNAAFEIAYDPGLKTLSVGGVDIIPGRVGARGFSEGRLAGRFELLNDALPQMQLQLDELARALIQGFEATDASLAPGQAGLFTDLGAAYNPLQLDGLAGRLSVNTAVDPNTGGALWRLRDGIGAVAQGPASDSTQTISFLTVFETAQSFDPQAGLGSTAELMNYVSGMVTDQKLVQVQAQEKLRELGGRAEAVGAARQSVQGVNLDTELQKLTLIEQSFAANAQVIQSLTQMIDSLLAAV
ncbi:MAG: flagellar hook-associated protein FlgK [Amylibacter sp.]|nr:flagellar hook-associated protein FlgK [Amylibacter sp.]